MSISCKHGHVSRCVSSVGKVPGGRDVIGGFGKGFGGRGFVLGFFGSLLHSPLSDFDHLHHSFHPSLQVGCRSLHPPFQTSPSQLPPLLGSWCVIIVILLCQGSGRYESIWNVKTKYIYLRFFKPVWNESGSNMKQYEIWRQNMKIFVPIWNQSETSLKPVWSQSEANMKHSPMWNILILIIWINLKYTENSLEF